MVGNDERNSLLYHTFRGYKAFYNGIQPIDISKESAMVGNIWYNVSVIVRIILNNGPLTSGELLQCHYETYRNSGINFSRNMDSLNSSYKKSFENQLKRAKDEYKVVRALDVTLFKELTDVTWEGYVTRVEKYSEGKRFPIFPYPLERYEKLISHKNHIIYILNKDAMIKAFFEEMFSAFDSIKRGFQGVGNNG